MSEWISVKDRLPAEDDLVLGATDLGCRLVFYMGPNRVMKEGFWFINEEGCAIIHNGILYWMPIPDPPK